MFSVASSNTEQHSHSITCKVLCFQVTLLLAAFQRGNNRECSGTLKTHYCRTGVLAKVTHPQRHVEPSSSSKRCAQKKTIDPSNAIRSPNP